MIKVIKVLLIIVLVAVSLVWILFLGSGHNVPSSTHVSFLITILILSSIIIGINKSDNFFNNKNNYITKESLGAKFLHQCKANYHEEIRPSRKETFKSEGHQMLVDIAKQYFNKGEIEDFSGFFQEHQYNVNLWVAHLIIEYGQPDDQMKKEALKIIERHTETPIDKELAKEEKEWLAIYNNHISD